jgi:uncharacterized protein YoxC
MKKNLTESLAYECVRLVFKSRLEDLTEAALNEGVSDGIMLLEKFDENDAANLEKNVKAIADMIGSLESKLSNAGEGWKPVVDSLKNQVSGLDTKAIAQLAISGDTKKLAKASAEYTKKVQTIASEVAAILDATEQMRKNLKNFEDDVGDNKSETIASLSDKVEKFPDVSKLEKGIDSVYKVPKWFQSAWAEGSKSAEKETKGGFFKKAMSFIGGLFKGAKTGRVVDAKVLADAIKATPYEALMALDLQGEVQALTGASQGTAGETAELASAGVAASGDGEGGESSGGADAEAVEKELGAPPASEEESAEEQAAAEEELEAAAQDAASEPVPPAVAAAKALDDWQAGLSKSSQQALATKDRIGSLKTAINTSLEGGADALAKEVQSAVASWRSEHEETLMKSRRFAKKNFDSLESLIPQLVSMMLKKTSESQLKLTKGMVHKTVHNALSRKFNTSGTLLESSRWQKLAGMGEK